MLFSIFLSQSILNQTGQQDVFMIYRYARAANLALSLAPAKISHWLFTPPGMHLPALALTLWRERPDLQKQFDIRTIKGRQGLARWFVFNAFGEMSLTFDEATRLALAPWHTPFPRLPVLAGLPITWLMRAASRRDKLPPSSLTTPAGQRRLVSWYARIGLSRYGWLPLLPDAQARAMAEPDPAHGAPRILGWLWDDEPDIRARFTGPADPALGAWLQKNGAARFPVLADPRIGLAEPSAASSWLGFAVPGQPPAPRWPAIAVSDRPSVALPFGVNLIGHARGRLGVGEDVRMAARALASVGVPFVVRDVEVGKEVESDDEMADALSEAAPYRFTMFVTTGMETVRAVRQLDQSLLQGRLSVGFWPWELPEFPVLWHHAYRLVDEVWASSRYTHDAYARSVPVPLRHMPMAVTVEPSEGRQRADFALPEGRFLFIFTYDALSRDARKNPLACLAAFDRAFPQGDEPVGLVVKGHRADKSPAWEALAARAVRDPRLFLFDRSLSRGALLDLYRACDCFVSLHRAEGFGRNIAECMALGKPVVVTAHSGNMDFTRSDTAALVPAALREVRPGEYPYAAGQIWAEPDVGAAAAQLRRVFADSPWRGQIATSGAARIAQSYAPEVVGRAWHAGLEALERRFAGR